MYIATMYFITTLTELGKNSDKKCFGYYSSKERALAAVRSSGGSINNGIYNFIVVERISEGIGSTAKEEIWFQWVNAGEYLSEGHWSLVVNDQVVRSVGNYSIG